MATDLQKPDGLTVLTRADLPGALLGFGLTDLCGIAGGMERRLRSAGVETVAQLCGLTIQQWAEITGSRIIAQQWHANLRGEHVHWKPVRRKTVGHGHVLPPQWRSDAGSRKVAVRLLHKAAERMRPGMQWVASRTSTNIWHEPTVEISCTGNQVKASSMDYDGADSHRDDSGSALG